MFAAVSLSRGPFEPSPGASGILTEEERFTIAVDVEGEVVRPGLIELEVGGDREVRVADVLEAAGGLLPTADTEYVERNLNLASVVSDGMKLYVPKKGLSNEGAATNPASDKVNVNTAGLSVLTTLKGIGEARAKAIIDNRPYASLTDLKTRAKLPESVAEAIKDEIAF